MKMKCGRAGRRVLAGGWPLGSLLFATLVVLISCEGNVEPKPESTGLTKAEFLGRIMVQERYWRVEEITRQEEDQIATVNVRENSPMLNSYYLHDVIPFVALQFKRGTFGKGTVSEGRMSGAYGKVPFGTFQCVLMSLTIKNSGEWAWDEERKMLKFALPGSIRTIAGALSGSDWLPDTGYVAAEPAPLFRSVEEARRAASPERIKVLVEEHTEAGKVTYAFIMRAAWLTDVENRDAEHQYGVSLY
ncbi:hypothetical protein [Dyadobacter fermentans]|uniref:Lipoprotein n=1 Tax=Dyadobacter fermentans (strain ATCC 700827 / DSM 18053 / CIP 107007 / KCTC 52180 / NS114) TaxID=471854 RepID=C6W665_DYAFD|nr:hypothetical protein [Dyadobacter fermentans]ACT92545.1 hypothetical protein Dfer_1297 [Dyadobacter fermentans DSM 18053]